MDKFILYADAYEYINGTERRDWGFYSINADGSGMEKILSAEEDEVYTSYKYLFDGPGCIFFLTYTYDPETHLNTPELIRLDIAARKKEAIAFDFEKYDPLGLHLYGRTKFIDGQPVYIYNNDLNVVEVHADGLVREWEIKGISYASSDFTEELVVSRSLWSHPQFGQSDWMSKDTGQVVSHLANEWGGYYYPVTINESSMTGLSGLTPYELLDEGVVSLWDFSKLDAEKILDMERDGEVCWQMPLSQQYLSIPTKYEVSTDGSRIVLAASHNPSDNISVDIYQINNGRKIKTLSGWKFVDSWSDTYSTMISPSHTAWVDRTDAPWWSDEQQSSVLKTETTSFDIGSLTPHDFGFETSPDTDFWVDIVSPMFPQAGGPKGFWTAFSGTTETDIT